MVRIKLTISLVAVLLTGNAALAQASCFPSRLGTLAGLRGCGLCQSCSLQAREHDRVSTVPADTALLSPPGLTRTQRC